MLARPASLILFLLCFLAPAAFAQETLTPAQKSEVERIVREMIRNNPELLIESLERHQERERDAKANQFSEALVANRRSVREDPHSVVIGNPNGDITVVEFFDYRCPYCKQGHQQVLGLLQRDPKVRVLLKEFPILGPESTFASRAAIAARWQNKYEPFHTALIETRSLNENVVFRLAADVGLDIARLKADMQRPEVDAIIASNRALAQKLGINGTPAFIIGDQLLPGAVGVDRLAAAVNEARAGCKTC